MGFVEWLKGVNASSFSSSSSPAPGPAASSPSDPGKGLTGFMGRNPTEAPTIKDPMPGQARRRLGPVVMNGKRLFAL
jgi:hypothetical protein